MSINMALQSTYNSAPPIAYAGQLEGYAGSYDIVSMINATTATSMPFGMPVKLKGSPVTDKDVDVLSANTDVVFGIVIHSNAYARVWTDSDGNSHGNLDATGLVAGTVMNVLRRGKIAVLCTSTTHVGDNLHTAFNATGSTFTLVGQVGGTGETAHTIKSTGTQFLTAASAGGFAWLDCAFINSVTTAD